MAPPHETIDDTINNALKPFAENALAVIFFAVDIGEQSIPLILIWLVAAALFFTVYMGFANIRLFKHAIDLVRGKFDDPKNKGQINRFQALTTSLSGTVGLGNIAGVAVAISVGGPGAMVWMILMGLFGMSSKFVECALGVKYRHSTEDGRFFGGPMYYLRDGFAEFGEKFGWFGKFMGGFFALCCIGGCIGGGGMFQSNQAYQQLVNVSGGDASFLADKGWLIGLMLAVSVGAVIIGGIQSIARVASRVVPLMAGLYLLAGLVVLGMNFGGIPDAFGVIFKGAFGVESAAGGFLGALIQGVRRAAFSNEAGIGSAAIAHAAAKTDCAVSQGLVAMLGPFIDTIVICTMTALVIVVSGAYIDGNGMEGVELTSRAFGSAISWFPYVLAVAVLLFAFSTMISWSYYGSRAFAYLFGDSKDADLSFKMGYCALITVGASADLGNVINLTDAMIFAMAIPNIVGLYILAPGLKRDLNAYIQKIKLKE